MRNNGMTALSGFRLDLVVRFWDNHEILGYIKYSNILIGLNKC